LVRRIGCFITDGWTEAGAMGVFLKKINSNFEYIQCFPSKPKYKKGLEGKLTGLSGDALIEEVYRRVELYKNEYMDYSAIIIEDDLDCRFHNQSHNEIDAYKNKVRQTIWVKLGKEVPVIFLYASPEIEAWFICDWDNSFAQVYKDQFFCHQLKKYLDEKVINEYWQKGIENFGMIEGKYTKLSDLIVNAVTIGVRDEIRTLHSNGKIPKDFKSIIDDRSLFYSKKIQGDEMLRSIKPDNFVEQCSTFFKPAFIFLKNFNVNGPI
jgi:hypothetical protein